MILALAVALGLAADLARFRGRALNRIASIPLRSAWLALLALAVQWPLLGQREASTPGGLAHALFLASHLLLLAFVWRNRHLAAIRVVGIGIVCNLAAILANGGFMPISPGALVQINPGTTPADWPIGVHYGSSKDVILARPATALWFLTDILAVPPPFPWPAAFSLGDLIVAAGILLLLCWPPAPAQPQQDSNARQILPAQNRKDQP